MTRPIILVLALLATAHQAVGTLSTIVDWLKGVGIEYIPPRHRDGTCRDCTIREVKYQNIALTYIYIYLHLRGGLGTTSHQPSRQDPVVLKKQKRGWMAFNGESS